MRIKSWILGVVFCLVGSSVFAADRASGEENVGVGAGIVVGAAIAGPPGAILGGAIGAKLGDVFGKRKQEVARLDAELDGSQQRVGELEHTVVVLNRDIDSLGADMDQLHAVARPELLALLQAGIEMELLFRTDEHVLSTTTSDRLDELATSIAAMADVNIKLDGYADERGDAAYNQGLSVLRVEHVRDLLRASGVPANRIQINAHGESPSADSSVDSYALERKVRLTLFIDASPSFAANPVQ